MVDQHILRQLNARYSKDWEPAPWPGSDAPAESETKAEESRLAAFARRADAAMNRLRKRPR